MLGQYDSQVANGQRRVLLVAIRLIMPRWLLDHVESIGAHRKPGGRSSNLARLNGLFRVCFDVAAMFFSVLCYSAKAEGVLPRSELRTKWLSPFVSTPLEVALVL